jgi:2-succinyl-5-enolpyruvyl-6-hydroxy-3-cyclohexene-1-carboxylate synthase
MKIPINRNIVWSDLFVSRLVDLGVRNACISPGSRSTSLTLAFASNKNISIYNIVDERSSAFFALGLAKKTKLPVAVVTTSGTAVAELLPAIIEAYYQRIPLIICTADRPPILINSGANQTINQHNIYKDHIRFFIDAGLPDITNLKKIKNIAEDAIRYSCFLDNGPVHINLPFEKPFEPNNNTDKVDLKIIENNFLFSSFEIKPPKQKKINFNSMADKFSKKERGIILVGYNNYSPGFNQILSKLSKDLAYPVYIDGASHLRFGFVQNKSVIENFTAMVRSDSFKEKYDPDIIIQFGGTPTANVVLEFFKNSKAEKVLVNEFGDRNDPSFTAKTILNINPEEFCSSIIQNIEKRSKSHWLNNLMKMNKLASSLKKEYIEDLPQIHEGKIISELIEALPVKCNFMISNSLAIRDIDFFSGQTRKQIHAFSNRGASGIDGITSTALGIASASKEPTILLTGDLAFFHDMNGLHNSYKYKIPLTIILINNGGGGIFESLPISEYDEFFRDNFLTPLNLDFRKFVDGYNGSFLRINSWKELGIQLRRAVKSKRLMVLEIKTDAVKSKQYRQKYWLAAADKLNQYINEINS